MTSALLFMWQKPEKTANEMRKKHERVWKEKNKNGRTLWYNHKRIFSRIIQRQNIARSVHNMIQSNESHSVCDVLPTIVRLWARSAHCDLLFIWFVWILAKPKKKKRMKIKKKTSLSKWAHTERDSMVCERL